VGQVLLRAISHVQLIPQNKRLYLSSEGCNLMHSFQHAFLQKTGLHFAKKTVKFMFGQYISYFMERSIHFAD
jgi:hypothetical protein